jgi:MFS family permease
LKNKLAYFLLSFERVDFFSSIIFLYLTQHKGLSTSQSVFLALLPTILGLVVDIPFGYLADRTSHLKVWRVGLIVAVFSVSLMMITSSYAILLIAFLLQGASFSITNGALLPLIYNYFPITNKKSFIASSTSFNYAVRAFSLLIAAVLYGINHQLPFILYILIVIGYVVVSFSKTTIAADARSIKEKLFETKVKNGFKLKLNWLENTPTLKKVFYFAIITVCFAPLIESSWVSYPILYKHFGVAPYMFGVIFFLHAMVSIVIGVGLRKIEITNRIIAIISLLYIPFSISSLLILKFLDLPLLFVSNIFIAASGPFILICAQQYVLLNFSKKYQSTLLSIFSSLNTTAYSFTGIVMAYELNHYNIFELIDQVFFVVPLFAMLILYSAHKVWRLQKTTTDR